MIKQTAPLSSLLTEPLRPDSALHEQATQQLRILLVEGVIKPGSKLNERELAEQLAISRTPLREAIKRLAAEGLVELIANRGAIALELTERDVEDTFEVMAGLEGQSGELAAQRITAQELSEIKAQHFEMLAAYTRRDLSKYYQINARIHELINLAAKNPVLSSTYRNVNARIQALRFRSNQDEDKWLRAVIEHKQMIEALEQRDSAALRRVLVAHLMNKRLAVLALLKNTSLTSDKSGSNE